MSRQITDEHIKFSIIVNGDPAQKELIELEKATRKLNEENKSNLLQRKELEKQGKKDTAQYIALNKRITENSAAIEVNKDKMFELQRQLGLMSLSTNQLNSKAMVLRMTLKNLVPGTEDYKKYKAQLTAVQNRLSELNGKAQQSKLSLSSMADGFNKYQGLALSFIAGLTGVVFSIQKIIDINGKLSDAQADVMKTTEMNKKEVDELTKSFGLLETRTSRIDLLKIAEQGGRIGIMKDDIGAFVDVMNKASVSLGDSFTGGAEEVANKLGKIKFLFQETKDLGVEQAYNSIGSAINDLGANGVASEANIAEFTTRIGSLTDVLKPSIQETLALGTAFEESGIEAEVSARAYNIFMKQASTESAKFAKVMGISQKSVENMINTNPLDFMMKFAEGMRGMDATKTAKTLDFLGVNADGANKVIGAMGNNINRFRELIDLSNNSFASGTSLINEYNIKNENLAATLEKISKRISGFFSSQGFIDWLEGAVTWISKFIGASEDADGSVAKWRNTIAFTIKIFGILTAAIITNVGWQKLVAMWTTRNTEATILYNVAEKARAFITGLSTIATEAQSLVVAIATRNTIAAKEATIALGTAMKTTPWGFILSALAAIVVAYQMFSDKVTKAAAAQQVLSDVNAEALENISKEKSELELLTKIAKDNAVAHEDRLAAIQKLNDKIPDHIGILTLENIANQEGTNILKAYTDEIYKNARARAVQATYDKLVSKKVATEAKSLGEYSPGTFNFKNSNAKKYTGEEDIKKQAYEFTKTLKDRDGNLLRPGTQAFQSYFEMTYKNIKAQFQSYLDAKNEELAVIDAQIKALEPEITKNTVAGLAPKEGDTKVENGITYKFSGGKWVKFKSTFTAPDGAGDGSKKNPNSTAEDLAKLKYDNDQRWGDLTLKLKRQLEDEAIALMEDGYKKEMAIENLRYVRAMQDLERQKVDKEEIIKLDAEIAKAAEAGDKTKVAALTQIKEGWKQKNAQLNEQINQLELNQMSIHNLKVASIAEKAAQDAIQKEYEEFERAKIIRETKFNEEYAALGNNEKAKAKLKREYEKNELDIQEEFLNKLIDEFNQIVGKGEFKEIDLSLLTPEQVEHFTKEAEKLGMTLSELIKKKNELGSSEAKSSSENFQSLGLQGTTDIFGFTPDNWTTLLNNLKSGEVGIQEMVFAVQALTNMWAMYGQYVTANENAQLARFERNTDRKKLKLKRMLDQGFISQSQYNKGVEGIDNDLAKKKADIEYKQAKRQRTLAIANIIQSTAQGIIGLWANPGFPLAIPLSVMVGAIGALQLTTVMKTPLPAKGYEQGLYGDYVKREQDGKVFKSSGTSPMRSGLFSKPRILVGEGPGDMPEMVIDKQAYRQLSPATRNALLREIRGIKGFENGDYNTLTKRIDIPNTPQAPNGSSTDTELIKMMLAVIAENTATMKDLRENGVIGMFSDKDWGSLKKIQGGIKTLQQIKDKSKK